MRKWIALLLSALMLFSLTACDLGSGGDSDLSGTNTPPQTDDNSGGGTNSGSETNKPPEGYDAEFTIYVNGTEEWTPFPEKKGTEFVAEDEDIVSLSDNGTTVTITGTQIGDTEIGAMLDDKVVLAIVHVRAMGGDINYKYNPPTDNYYIAFENIDGDGDVNSEVVAHIGRQHMYSYDTTYAYHFVDFEKQKSYDRDPNGSWMSDPEGLGLDMEDDWSGAPLPLSAMEEYFMDTLYALGGDASRLAEYYVGTETLYPAPYENTGIKCWVFDTAGFNGNNLKFWIDPSNGCCLKYEDTEDGDVTVVTEYYLNYTSWNDVPG